GRPGGSAMNPPAAETRGVLIPDRNPSHRSDQMTDAQRVLIDGLNEDLAAEYQAVVMYRTYASLVSGPYRQELRSFFEAEIPDELGHAAFLADKIVALGGRPTVEVPPIPYTDDNRTMLENALQAEIDTIDRYT